MLSIDMVSPSVQLGEGADDHPTDVGTLYHWANTFFALSSPFGHALYQSDSCHIVVVVMLLM